MESVLKITKQDQLIQQCIRKSKTLAPQELMRQYAAAGDDRLSFVAALIARLCVLEAAVGINGLAARRENPS